MKKMMRSLAFFIAFELVMILEMILLATLMIFGPGIPIAMWVILIVLGCSIKLFGHTAVSDCAPSFYCSLLACVVGYLLVVGEQGRWRPFYNPHREQLLLDFRRVTRGEAG